MRKLLVQFLSIGILYCCYLQDLSAQVKYEQQWPSFRGPWGRGYINNSKTPTGWSIDSSVHIKWKTAIPGLGHSSPVVWDNYLFVTTASRIIGEASLKVGLYGDIDEANDSIIHEFKVYCLDKFTGKIIWERVAHRGIPKSKRHTKSSQANCTPATDGKYLVVHFGSEGLYCYDLQGNLLWKKDMGILNPGPYTERGIEWGYASSPIIYKNSIIVQCDIPYTPYITSLDIATGNEIWRTSRRGEVSTWCTPAIYAKGEKAQVIANGYNRICGYDFETGKEIWRLSNGGDAPVPVPVVAHDLIFINSAHGKYSPIFAIRPDAQGDITLEPDSTKNRYIVWSVKRGGAYMVSPLVYGDYLYNLKNNGALTCCEAKTGKVKYQTNIAGAFTASGVAADGKIYYTSEEGNVYVISAGPEFRLVVKNKLRDICMATPAISENAIFFRTQHYLIAVE